MPDDVACRQTCTCMQPSAAMPRAITLTDVAGAGLCPLPHVPRLQRLTHGQPDSHGPGGQQQQCTTHSPQQLDLGLTMTGQPPKPAAYLPTARARDRLRLQRAEEEVPGRGQLPGPARSVQGVGLFRGVRQEPGVHEGKLQVLVQALRRRRRQGARGKGVCMRRGVVAVGGQGVPDGGRAGTYRSCHVGRESSALRAEDDLHARMS